jgi:hypothetical protein
MHDEAPFKTARVVCHVVAVPIGVSLREAAITRVMRRNKGRAARSR